MGQSEAFRPAGPNISGGQRLQILAGDIVAAMGYQVDFHKTRFGIVPISEGAHGNGILEQGAWLCRAFATPALLSKWRQAAVNGRSAHLQQKPFCLRVQNQFMVAFQYLHHLRYEGLQTFTADAATDAPDFSQYAHTFTSVFPFAPSSLPTKFRDPFPQRPDGMLAMKASRGYELVQDPRLFAPISLKLTWVRPLNQIIFTFLAHYMLPLFFHTDESNIYFEATLCSLVTFILSQCAPLPENHS